MRHLNSANVRFWFRWTAATAIALGLGAVSGGAGLLAGPLLLAIAQALALRGYWRQGWRWWFVATLVGGYGALAALVAIALLASRPVLMVGVGGAILGLCQAIVLRGSSRIWGWWPLVSIGVLLVSIGWFIPIALNVAIYGSQRPWWHWGVIIGGTGLLGGGLKGAALVWALKGTPLKEKESHSP